MTTVQNPPAEASHTGTDPQARDPEEIKRTCWFAWAEEIQEATVALLWHHPDLLEYAHRELDFDLHFSVPRCRILLRAIECLYSESCNEVPPDFHCMVHLLREWGEFDEVGGRVGMNELYSLGPFLMPEALLRGFNVGCLKEHAIARRTDPFKPVRYFSGGRAAIRPNKLARSENSPCVVGEGIWEGIKFRIVGWPQGDGGEVSLKLERAA